MIILKCNDCEHKDVCKFADDMTKIKAKILNGDEDLDNDSVVRITIDCKNYDSKYINDINIATSPITSPLTPYTPPSITPSPYKPFDVYYNTTGSSVKS